jgi:drug/metabolite transporter (DMT)-like permease
LVTRRAWLLFVAISLLWGLPYFFIKVAIQELDPAVIVFVRVSLAALVLLPLALARGAFAYLRGRWRLIVALAVLEIVLPFLLIAWGEVHITSSLTGLLIAADPLFVALLALRFDHSERVNGLRLLGLLVGLLGVAVLLGLDVVGSPLALLGASMVLAAAFCYGVGALLIKHALSGIPQLGGISAALGIAAVLLAPLALTRLPAAPPSVPVMASLLALALACTALGFVTYFSLIAEAGASRASVITYVNPAVAVALGVAILGEPLTAAMVAGFGLVLAGCALSTGGRLPPGLRAVASAGRLQPTPHTD